MHSSRMRAARSSSRPGGVFTRHLQDQAPWEQTPQTRHPTGTRHPPGPGTPRPGPGTLPPVNRVTNRCKNITLPQTSFAGGKNSMKMRLKNRKIGPFSNTIKILTHKCQCFYMTNPGNKIKTENETGREKKVFVLDFTHSQSRIYKRPSITYLFI